MTKPPQIILELEPQTQLDPTFACAGDSMCSWCRGFAPALEELDSRYGIPLRVVMGGLRTGSKAEPIVGARRIAQTTT